ncbi:aldehyde dehydrogenase family protein [Mesorhizobium muleiense]|uniref:aldehyde dehydrogenase family protein n=1 Tax=Mesorhizobium muleiense TaxID=1004279 RepID=UPI001F42144A|nr:aldehyde dehydrogenase family protein [Mesorhizobium muleiense]MCF6116829.1 aldehyde dehydrogenase family protein [Mesorhizobium muleiense]
MTGLSETAMRLPRAELYIGGQWQASTDGRVQTVINPSSGQPLGTISMATASDVSAAVNAARAQFETGAWSRLSGADRGKLLWRLADLVEANRENLAYLEAIDIGRPYFEPFLFEIPLAAETFRHFAGWADKIGGCTFDLPDLDGRQRHSYTLRQPVGVVAAITPWNAPTMIASWKLGPALAAGNTVVIKPAEDASLSTIRLVELIEEAGFPPGVVNLVTGSGALAGDALVRHPGIDKISFTGSPGVGRRIAAIASEALKKVTLELGGKSPQIVCRDADLDRVIPGASISLFANQGQTCASGSRVLVHESIAEEVTERLVAAAESIVVGDPFAPETQMGSLVSERQLERVSGFVLKGKAEGAHLLTGGNRIDRPGYFYAPTLFAGGNELTIAREEIFGPVGTIIRFRDDEEALRLANQTDYGLTSVVWTRDLATANRFAKHLRAGSVWVNAWGPPHPALPWLGVKTSGLGQELGRSGILANTVEKTVSVIS